MKLDEDLMMKANTAALAPYGLAYALAPKKTNDIFYTTPGSRINASHTSVLIAANCVSVLTVKNKQAKKNMCKAQAAHWAAHMAVDAVGMVQGTVKKETLSYVSCVNAAVLVGLNLYVGFKKDK